MKTIYILIISLFVVTSCNSPEEKNNSNNETQRVENDSTTQKEDDSNNIQYELSYQWILIKQKSLKKDTTLNFSPTPPSIITEFKISGYFNISDLIKIDSDKKKVQKLESRVSGQWELHGKQLVMRFGTNDSTNVKTYQINKLDEDSLVLQNVEEGVINTYSKRK